MIKKLVVMAVLLPLIWPSTGAADLLTALKLLESCEHDSANFCLGYVLGVADSVTFYADPDVCFPEDAALSAAQLRLVYIDWAKRNPAKLHYDAFDAVKAAFMEGFLCEQ